MYHLGFKDYLVLIGAGIAMIAISLIFLYYGNPVERNMLYEGMPGSETPGQIVNNTGVFNCEGDIFRANVPASEFEFDSFPFIKPGIEKECFWSAEGYNLAYMKGEDPNLDLSEAIDSFFFGPDEGYQRIEYRELADGLEAVYFDMEKREYQAARIIVRGNKMFTLGYFTPDSIGLNDSNYRSFVGSFSTAE